MIDKKSNFDRKDQEQTEGLSAIKKDVPVGRFQADQQIQNTADAIDTKASKSTGFDKETVKSKGSVLKQEVASKVVTKGLGGEISLDGAGTRSLSYSGNEGTVLGSAAYTPAAGRSRSDSRSGKKLDDTAKKINYVASEQVIEDFDESKPLAESPDSVQGYNGTYRNANARSQKNNGNVPGELMFQRSVDEIKRDQLYFATGQVVSNSGVNTADTPHYIPTLNERGVYTYSDTPNYTLHRGNYHNRFLHVHFNANGKVDKFTFDTVDLSTTAEDGIANQASSHAMIDRNYAEMDRQIIDQKAGDEKAELWSPLARAVKEPSATVGYLRDIENILGTEVFLAYKKTAACHSYQLNRAAKDGLKTYSPLVEAAMGLIMPELSSAPSSNINNIFSVEYYKKGAATLMIDAYDSKSKYQTKADLLIQPRSFKMHLQTADNNMDPLRVKAEYVQLVNNREVFSTIDRDYDPLMPVCISDKAANIHCYDFNELYAFESLNDNGTPNFTNPLFKYMYSDLRNNYVVTASCSLLEGIHQYLESMGSKFRSLLGNEELVIPMTHSTCFFSLWSLIVLAATPYILHARTNSMKDVLYYEQNVEYPFHQLIKMGSANPMNAVNYVNDSYTEPLKTKQMMPSTALSWVMPEVFWPFDEETSDDTFKYVLPWYFNENSFTYANDGISINVDESTMSMPSIRSGARFGYLDSVYSMTERDLRLSLDRLVSIPEHDNNTGKFGVYKYSQNADGIPFITMSKTQFSIANFLSLPRELGTFIVAPAEYLSHKFYAEESDTATENYASSEDGVFGQSSYIIKFWHGKNPTTFTVGDSDQAILLPITINVDRSTAYKQDWNAYPATIKTDGTQTDYGWVPAIGCLIDSSSWIAGRSTFKPFTNGISLNGAQDVLDDDAFSIISLQKAIWARIQKLPFALSPFDFCSSVRRAGEDAPKFDPYDFLYYFGFAGMRASDYREDVYNRLNEIVNQGFTFLEDPFIKDSPIFKESVSLTQSANDNSLVTRK